MTPQGVEQFFGPWGAGIYGHVPKTMTPQGVEQHSASRSSHRIEIVPKTMTPQGVEQLTAAGAGGLTLPCRRR